MIDRLKRSRNQGKKIWALLFVLVSLFCMIFFAARGRFEVPVASNSVMLILSPLQMGLSWIEQKINYAGRNLWEILTVHNQNQMLKNEVEQLRQQNTMAREFAAENERLRALLSYKQSAMQFDLLAARVIGRDVITWSSMIVIDRGTSDGLKKNMPVVTGKGLVGHVTETGIYSSKVQLLLDPRSAVGVLIQRPESRVAGVVEGDLGNPLNPRMINIPKNSDVKDGDMVITSGFGGFYPKGLVVGSVASQKNDEGGLLKIAIIDTAVDFQKLEDVAVIVASRESIPANIEPPVQTPGTETIIKSSTSTVKTSNNAGVGLP